jgi:hypothetical protein
MISAPVDRELLLRCLGWCDAVSVADPSAAAATSKLASARVFDAPASGGRVLTGTDPDTEHLVVAYRGSGADTKAETWWNVQDDAFAVPVAAPELSLAAGVHAGFYRHWRSLQAAWSVTAPKVIVTGFSLGGACAVLEGLRRALAGAAVRVVTLGAPRAFTRQAAPSYDLRLRERTWRVYLPGDEVVGLPPSVLGYRHVGEPVALRRSRPDLQLEHSRAEYRAAVTR